MWRSPEKAHPEIQVEKQISLSALVGLWLESILEAVARLNEWPSDSGAGAAVWWLGLY